MSKKLGLMTIHGMGKKDKEYHQGLTKRLKKRLGKKLWDQISFESIYYHKEMQDNQNLMWERMKLGRDLDSTFLRKFMLHWFSDAANIQNYSHDNSMGLYATTQVKKALELVNEGIDDETPIVVVAHSLGNQVLSNYIWDAQKGKGIYDGEEASAVEKFSQLRVWFSTGNNMPFFVSGTPQEYIKAIEKPEHPQFEWLNYYDRDDALGWPLKPISDDYDNNLKISDIEINTGFTPLSHLGYWKDDDFLDPLEEKLRELL